MDNGWITSIHSQRFPGLANCKLQSVHDNQTLCGPPFSRPEPTEHLSLGSPKEDLVYRGLPATIGELKNLISDNIQRVDADKDFCGRVIETLRKE